ncbi:acyl-CoA-binding domain-containing protein 5 isoform X1 [Oryza glaberrima]|uniref:ACB domain-containing protein n=2 Tax=Oryza TaxID=4527 RepID=A0A0D3FG35_9ORYZ|nr:acyl-CoA-binding domain-containing protein 5 isoform X1 [Oryza glaberrima]
MELFYELLLTAAASLLVAFLLARLLASAATASDPRRRAPDHAAVIAEEEAEAVVEEERIIEVDEVEVKSARAGECVVSEGWVEVGRASAAEGKLECLPEEEEAPAKAARELVLDAVLEEREEEGQVGEERCDLAAAVAEVVGVKPHELGVEAAPGEVFDVTLEEGKVQDVGVEQHDLVAEVAPTEALDTGLEKQGVPIIEAVEIKRPDYLGAEVAPSDVPEVEFEQQGVRIIEAIDVKQHHRVDLAAPAEVVDAGLEERVQAMEAGSSGLTSETVPEEVLDELSEKEEEQVIEEKEHQLAAETAPIAIPDVALTETEELKEEQSSEQAVNVHEEVQSKDEAKCKLHLVDQQEGLASKVELVGRNTDNVEISHGSSSGDKMIAELTEEELTLQGVPADETETDMEFGEWEGIERTEIEKRFGVAAAFASSDAGMAALSKLDSDVQLQLQGLLKVAIDGPCYDSTQPLTLRPSSRAKWAAWQKLGNMYPETAMERYMNLLSEAIPGWMGDNISGTKEHEAGDDAGGSVLTMTSNTINKHDSQGNEDNTGMYESHLTSSPNPEKGQSSDIPAE